MVHGVGVEIIRVERFARAIERWGDRLLERLFTDGELAYCMARHRPEVHLAARFAAKASLSKALGSPLSFRDVEVVRGPSGAPGFKAERLGALTASLSISHTTDFAVAATVVEGP